MAGRTVFAAYRCGLFSVNAHYDDYCFQPIHLFEAATGKPVLSLLRPGKRPSGDQPTVASRTASSNRIGIFLKPSFQLSKSMAH